MPSPRPRKTPVVTVPPPFRLTVETVIVVGIRAVLPVGQSVVEGTNLTKRQQVLLLLAQVFVLPFSPVLGSALRLLAVPSWFACAGIGSPPTSTWYTTSFFLAVSQFIKFPSQ